MTKLQKELSNAIRSIECITTYCESDGKPKVKYNGSEICTVMSGGQIHYKSENELTEEQNEAFEKIEHKADIIKEYLSAYDARHSLILTEFRTTVNSHRHSRMLWA